MQVPEALSWWFVLFYLLDVVVKVCVIPMEVVKGGVDGDCGMAMLNMAGNFFSDTVF